MNVNKLKYAARDFADKFTEVETRETVYLKHESSNFKNAILKLAKEEYCGLMYAKKKKMVEWF